MTKAGKVKRLRVHLARGVKKITRITTYDKRRRRAIGRLLAEQGSIVMFDDVDVALIPSRAAAVAGYVDGAWPTFESLREKFPHAWKLSIATSPKSDAHCLDIERGDASPAEAPDWLVRQINGWAKDYLPVLYVDKADAPALIADLADRGIKRGRYRLWVADWTYMPHICGPSSCGAGFTADATQWTDRANGASLDQSLCAAGFFPGTR